MWNAYGNRCGKEQLMDKIDTEIRFAGMAEERLRREDPHYRVWSFTDDDDLTVVDKNLIVDTISQIGSVALDAARDNAIDNVNEEVNQALAFERKQERKHVARVFAELGIDRQKAINLLVFEWDTDRRDAEELMLEAHRIYWPLERLKRHLRNEDWTMSEISDFLHDYEVARQLRTNRRLSDLTAAGLVDWLQKNQD